MNKNVEEKNTNSGCMINKSGYAVCPKCQDPKAFEYVEQFEDGFIERRFICLKCGFEVSPFEDMASQVKKLSGREDLTGAGQSIDEQAG